MTVLHMKSVCFQIRMTVDDNFQEEYIFSDDVQFLTAAEVWLGGTPNTFERTGGNVRTNFDGGVALVSFFIIIEFLMEKQWKPSFSLSVKQKWS